MNTLNNEKINYVENNLSFHFDGKFNDAVLTIKPTQEFLNQWVSVAVLYKCAINDSCLDDSDKENIFSLVEDFYWTADADMSMFGNLDEIILEDVGYGFSFSREKYISFLKRAYELVKENGLDLYKLEFPD